MSLDPRLAQLRERAQAARCDDHTTMTDSEVDELVALERLHEAEKAAIRAELRQQAEARAGAETRQEVRKVPTYRPSCARSNGLELIARGLADQH